MEIKWYGWASFKIKAAGKVIYLDPFMGADEKADIILVSHSHPDHSDSSTIEKIRKPESVVLTSADNASNINAEAIAPGKSRKIGGINVQAAYAYNLKIPNHQKGNDTGFIIEAEGKRLYFAADTDLIPEMKNLGKIDIALLPIGGTYTMDLEQAVEAVKQIKPKTAIPMHYGKISVVFGGKKTELELKADPKEFKRKVEAETGTKAIPLKRGESTEI